MAGFLIKAGLIISYAIRLFLGLFLVLGHLFKFMFITPVAIFARLNLKKELVVIGLAFLIIKILSLTITADSFMFRLICIYMAYVIVLGFVVSIIQAIIRFYRGRKLKKITYSKRG